jgi:hypothetical protein
MSKKDGPEFVDWQEEAEFWDATDTTVLIKEEEGEWVGPGRVRAAPGLCRQCGAQMELRRLDVSMAHGRIVLHEAEFYVCSRCGARVLSPDRQEFFAWPKKTSAETIHP